MTTTTCQCGKPTAGAVLCEDCTKTFRYAIANVAAHHADLGTVERKQTRYGSGAASKGSIGKEVPLIVDYRFTGIKEVGTQLRYDAWATVVAWCRAVMEDQPQRTGPACLDCLHLTCAAIRRNRWPRSTVPSMVAYLARQFGFIRSQDWAPVMLDEFLDLEQRLARMVNRPADRWYAGRCGMDRGEKGICETELYASSDERGNMRPTIECPGCKTRHDVAERRDFLLHEAEDYHVTATEAATALLAWTDYGGTTKKIVDRIAYWRASEVLDDRGVTEVGGQWRKVYRLGDIQDLLVGRVNHDTPTTATPTTAA